jgi:nitroreductase
MTERQLKPARDSFGIDAAITTRYSCRAFLADKPVPRHLVEEILDVAKHSPSGTNTQPWKVYVLRGQPLQRMVTEVCDTFDEVAANPAAGNHLRAEYDYYPSTWVSPYNERRRENGWGLYGLLGIQKGDKPAMHAQHRRNFQFFDAPTGLMFTVSRSLARGSLIDYGMFLQNIMVAARARGLDTCPQAAWNDYASIVLRHLGASTDEMLVCGMAIGFADERAKVNAFQTPREPAKAFTHWLEEAGP